MARLSSFLFFILTFLPLTAEAGEVEDLRAQVTALQAELAQCRTAQANVGSAEENETAARALYEAAQTASSAGNTEEAQRILNDLMARYGNTRTASRATRLHNELSIVGNVAPAIEAEHWFGGEAGQWGEVTLVVFFETWCPHCLREIPNVNALYRDTYRSRGLTVLGFTKVTRNSTEATVRDFVAEHGLVFPIAKEAGSSMSEAFAVTGIPAAAVIIRGEVVWRGHPGMLSSEQFDQWLAEN